MASSAAVAEARTPRESRESIVVRFAGDSGDGMQLTGGQFTQSKRPSQATTWRHSPISLLRFVHRLAPTFGVSSFQINFGAGRIKTSGDAIDVLVAMNPAALKVELSGVRNGGVILVDVGSFSDRNIKRAGFTENPLKDKSLDGYRVIEIDMSALTMEAVKESRPR